MTRPSVTAADIVGVVGILPTPSLPGADEPDAVDTVNIAETVRMTEAVVASGVDVIMLNGTFGEVATLTRDELMAFTDAVVRTVAHRVPVFGGPSTANTRDTIDRGRALMKLGVDGLLVGRPMWLPLDDRQLVDYYRAIAAAIPDAAIVVYDNTGVFKGKISSAAYAGLAGIPSIVASKHLGIQGGVEVYRDDLQAVRGKFPLLPTTDNWLPTLRAFPADVPASWSGDVACGPEPVLALRDAIIGELWDVANALHEELMWITSPLFPDGDIKKFMPYSIQIDRAEFEAAGFIVPGPARHPYTSAPEAYLEGGAAVGRRWAEARERLLSGSDTAGRP